MSNPVERRTSLPSLGDHAGVGGDAGVERPGLPPPPPRRRSSRAIMLAVVGVGVAAIGYGIWSAVDDGEEQPQQRNGYASQQECEANYSKEQCTQGQTYRPGLGFMPIFWGPFYRGGGSLLGRSGDPGPGRFTQGTVVEKSAAAPSQRGGFGSNAASRGGSIGS